MGVLDTFRAFVDDGSLYECRDCGTKFDDDVRECMHCGSREISHYDV